jgi:MT0933-like antitoxin protein
MGMADKFKTLTKQAQDAVAEHKDELQDAVGAAGAAVDRQTRGKHSDKIAKMGKKANEAIDKFGADAEKDDNRGGGQTGQT